jgi:hypothetical protein
LYSAAATHPHLYSPTAIEYGIHTSSSNNSPSDQYYEHGEGYYNGSSGNGNGNNNSGSPMPETHIISSDNGLSYTNLDYIAYQQAHGNQAYLHSPDEKVHIPHHYSEEMMMASGQATLHHHGAGNNPWHHGPGHGYSVENSGPNQLNIATLSGNNLSSQQQISHSMHSPSGIQPTQSTSPALQSQQQQQQQSQQNVPQYKWMQVKRNVPKPQSELFQALKMNSKNILIDLNCEFYWNFETKKIFGFSN